MQVEQIRVMLVSEDRALRTSINSALDSSESFDICQVLEDPSDLEDAVWRVAPELIVATLGEECETTLEALRALGDRCPEVVMCGPSERSDLIIRSMRIGVREYVPLPLNTDELLRVTDRLVVARESREQAQRGAIIGVVGAKGGVGATVVVCQLAAALQASDSQVVILDLNLQSGDVALYHDLSPTYGAADLEREGGDVDSTYLRSLVETHASGVGMMASPIRAQSTPTLRPSRLQHALNILPEFNEFILLDLPRDWGELALAAIEMADEILVVTSLDVPALAHCKLQLRVIERAGVPRNVMQVIANNSAPNVSLSDRDIREFLGRPTDLRLPTDTATVMEAVNTGTSVADISAGSAIARGFEDLATTMRQRRGGAETTEAPRPRGISRVRNLILGQRHGAA